MLKKHLMGYSQAMEAEKDKHTTKGTVLTINPGDDAKTSINGKLARKPEVVELAGLEIRMETDDATFPGPMRQRITLEISESKETGKILIKNSGESEVRIRID
jgi:hypothetical protein